jgi:pSer/pThr/pTyr-binding forkhead associated (FHA) protein
MGATLTIKYAGQSREYKVPEDEPFYIGRGDSTLSMRINHASISRIHARIENKNSRWYVTDMGSRNGTQRNGEDLEGETLLDPGDELRIGKLKVIFTMGVPVASMDADDERTLVENEWEPDTESFAAGPDDEIEPISSKQSSLGWIEEEDTPVSDVDAEIVDPGVKEEEDDFGLGSSEDYNLDSQDTPGEDADWEENMVTVDGLGGDSVPSPTTPADSPKRRGFAFAAAGAAIFMLVAGAGAAGYFLYLKPSSQVEEQAGTQNADESDSDSANENSSDTENESEGDDPAPTDDPDGNEGFEDDPTDADAAPEDDPAPDSDPGDEDDEAPAEDPVQDSDVRGDLPQVDGVPVELPE